MKKKVLIYMKECYLKPVGGAAGYLYNLKSELDKKKETNIKFIEGEEQKSNIRKNIPRNIMNLLRIFKRNIEVNSLLTNKRRFSGIQLDSYDIIHFHNTFSMYKVKDSLKTYKGIVLLTSHSPKPMFLEIFEDVITSFERRFFKNKYYKLSLIDKYAFNRADCIIFPCQDAEEPYYKNWNEYKKIREINKDKYRYILTGINPCNAKVNVNEIREKYNIPKDAFVVSYVGRHNETKGYDVLKIIGERILKEKDNVYFLIAGKEEPLKGIKNNRWIEVGWTDDPHSIIAASDVFVLPNKETYFDIVMLEVLSLGKIVVASNTGGNKYFRKNNIEGVLLYESIEEAIQLINKVKNMSARDKTLLEESNQKLFTSKFTSEIFTNNYIKLLDEL